MMLSFTSFGALHVVRALAVILLVYPTLLLTACTGETAEQEGKAENAAADGTTKKKEVVPKPAPLRIRVVVPYGGNMPGFMNFAAGPGAAPTEFQHRIGGLLTAIGRGPTTLAARTFVTTDGAGNPVTSTYAQLAALVDGTRPRPYIHGLMIPPLLDSAVAACTRDPSVVTVLVTDLVHNAGDLRELSALHEIVKAKLSGPSGPAAFSVYAEPSRFVGNYYPAIERRPHEVNGTSIPYYIWLIGTPKQISRVARLYLPNPPARQAHVGLTYPNVAAGALLTGLPTGSKLKRGGQGAAWEEGRNVVIEDAAKGVEFSIGLDLGAIPTAWQDSTFLRSALHARLPDGAVTLVFSKLRPLTAIERATSTKLNPYTHTVRVQIKKLALGTSQLTLTLPAPELPAWRGEWTSAVDQPPGLTTYRLKQLLEGARQAHGAGPLPPVFSVSLPIINHD